MISEEAGISRGPHMLGKSLEDIENLTNEEVYSIWFQMRLQFHLNLKGNLLPDTYIVE